MFSKLSSELGTKRNDVEAIKLIDSPTSEKNEGKEKIAMQSEYLYKILKIMNAIGVAFLFAGIPMSKGFLIFVYGQ